MSEEPKGTILEGLDEEIQMGTGPILTPWGGKKVKLTRKIAVSAALESHKDAGDKFVVFDLGLRFHNANSSVSISAKDSVLIKAAIEEAWPQPGICVPICRWLEGEE